MDYDTWKTTDPRDYEPACPECGYSIEADGLGGFDCTNCSWFTCGPDPDRDYDRMRDSRFEDDWE